MTFEPPYTVVVFISTPSSDRAGYDEAALAMEELAATQPGFLGFESAGNATRAIAVSFWTSPEAAQAWRHNAEHAEIQREGRQRWYAAYDLHVATVHRHHRFVAD